MPDGLDACPQESYVQDCFFNFSPKYLKVKEVVFKAVLDDILNLPRIVLFFFFFFFLNRYKTSFGKGKNAVYLHLLLFQQCIQTLTLTIEILCGEGEDFCLLEEKYVLL